MCDVSAFGIVWAFNNVFADIVTSVLRRLICLFLNLFFLVRQKFSIPEGKNLTVTDDGGTEVDADVFPELVSNDLCFVIHDADSGGMWCWLHCYTIQNNVGKGDVERLFIKGAPCNILVVYD